MFLGHFAVGFAAKRAAPTTSLGILFICAQLVDLLWPVFLILGLENVRIAPGITLMTPLDFYDYPFTHSLLAAVGWSVAVGGVFFAVRKDLRTAGVLALVVFSHWVLDLISHRPDLPLAFGDSPKYGLGLWNSFAGTLVVEFGLLAAGVWAYASATSAVNRKGRLALWSLVGFLVLVYIGNVFGPPPPDAVSIGYAGLSVWLLVVWGFWIDGNRQSNIAVPRV